MKQLHVECKPDEALARILGRSVMEIIHHNDKGRVCAYLSRNNNLVGMIDEDPGASQPTYLSKLKEVSNDHNLRLLNDLTRGNKIIVVCPRLEDWIIRVCKLNKIVMEDYALSNRHTILHREINSKLNKFEQLLNILLTNKKSKELLHLKHLLNT